MKEKIRKHETIILAIKDGNEARFIKHKEIKGIMRSKV